MSRRTFVLGILAVLIGFTVLGVLINVLNGDRTRPEGVAEDWLVAVGDTTRKGVREESRERAEKHGPIRLARSLLAMAGDTDGKRAFSDLEIGKASGDEGGLVRVPYQLHVYDTDEAVDGVVVLEGVRVVGLDERRPHEKVPSEGGAPPSSAPSWVWLVGLAVGIALTFLCSLAVRLATPRPVS